ncbi:ThiF family adenylyltransferase [Candidatus Gottesmanbacteria bacterium]|nr:ThiF family adenylyltransferase [Candidatus Gottesmanbacteria bacterium]
MSNSRDNHCELFNPSKSRDAVRLAALKRRADVQLVDELYSQLEELYKIRNPSVIREGVSAVLLEKFIKSIYRGKSKDMFGVWAWYPWGKRLIHFLPEALHTELRTARNRNLITLSEQRRYYRARVGVAGLSVGNAVVSNIVHTGGAKYLRIADADVLSGSNMNRIRAGFDLLGVSKTTVAAREVLLVNPFTDLTVFDSGLTEKNIKEFLLEPEPLDIVVDEMDDLYLKIRLRTLARKHGIPVVMAADNGDGVVVDIERFDLDHKRPLMHGDIPEAELLAIRPDTPRPVAARIISRWVRPENIATRMMTSLLELGKTLYTWPQLGNAASMAGSVVSYVVRLIVLGKPVVQGKVVISPEAIFSPVAVIASEYSRHSAVREEFIRKLGL